MPTFIEAKRLAGANRSRNRILQALERDKDVYGLEKMLQDEGSTKLVDVNIEDG